MVADYNDRERRIQQALDRLGTNHPVCLYCGETEPLCLELHCAGAQAQEGVACIMCANCRCKQTDAGNGERRRQAVKRLGTVRPICVHCGETDLGCLQAHHIAGRAFHDDCAILCHNCHRKQSDAQRDHPAASRGGEPSALERIGHYLLGLADLLAGIVVRLREFGALLIAAAAAFGSGGGVQ